MSIEMIMLVIFPTHRGMQTIFVGENIDSKSIDDHKLYNTLMK